MNFTPRINVEHIVCGTLTIAVVGLISYVSRVAPSTETQYPMATQQYFLANETRLIVPAAGLAPVSDPAAGRPVNYQPVSSWYKSKHWWKRNAPIVGGAGGGALVGGLVGGGTGAVIGGAAGAGGGYLYKHTRHQHEHHYQHSLKKQAKDQPVGAPAKKP